MDLPRSLLVSMLLATGLACGIAAKRISQSQPASTIAPAHKDGARVLPPSVQFASIGEIRSKDTADTLLALPARELYTRLARWLLDGNEADISAFLQSYRQQGGSDSEITRLVFLHWTRHDPKGAIDAVANDEDRYAVWTAWACHDPHAALAADMAAGGNMIGGIYHAIGHFHPNWLLANFGRVPVNYQEIAISGFRSGTFNPADPNRMLKLAARWQNDDLLGATVSAAIRKSPLDAWHWLQEYRIARPDFCGTDSDLLDSLSRHATPANAGDLARIAETLPPGKSQRDLVSSTLELLAKVDPEAALAEARTTESARIRAEQLAIAGKAFVYHDPERAFQIADELFATCPQVFHLPKIQVPDGSIYQTEGERLYKIHPYFEALCVRDPERLMNSFLSHDPAFEAVGTFTTLSGIWAAHAPESYATWLNTQTDPRIREPAARELVGHLADQEQYAEALDWAISLHDPERNPTSSVFKKWRNFDPDSALEWLDAANLPADRKAQLREGGQK